MPNNPYKPSIDWSGILTTALQTVLTWILKLAAFLLWLTGSLLELLTREMNKKLKSYLFPNRK
jgi:hypothetical protein